MHRGRGTGLHIQDPQDAKDAAAYWRNHEFKKFAVDVTAGPHRRPTYASTWYAGARTAERAIECVKREACGLPPRARFTARLAGPRELGCVPTAFSGRGVAINDAKV